VTPDAYPTLEQHFVTFNAEHYIFLSEMGYKRGLAECAYYPLYPLLIRGVTEFTGVNDVLIGMLLANLFSIAAWALFHQMTVRRYGESVAALALTLLLLFPGSLFFQFAYTESLFFLLLMLFCAAMERQRLLLTMATGFLLPLTRAVGVFCVFPLMWHLFFRSPPVWWLGLANHSGLVGKIARFAGPRHSSPASKSPNWRRAGAVCSVLAPFLGWATYFLLMWKWTGNPFEGIEAQKQFGVHSIHHLFDPIRFLTELFNPTTWHGYRGSLLDRCVFIMLIDCFPLIFKLDKAWCVWVFFLGVVPAMSGGFTSFTRFASVVFPLFIALAVFLDKPGFRWLRWFTLAVFAILHLILVWRFVNFKWAG
jgi:hypothetical protein